MSSSEIANALDPISESRLPFAAPGIGATRETAAPAVWHLTVPYRQWDGPKLPWVEDFGKGRGQVYSHDGSDPIRSCNEVEVAKKLRRIREHAVWVSSYSPSQVPQIWRAFAVAPAHMPTWLQALDRQIRAVTNRASGGIPDVVAWNDINPIASAIFIECKGEKESIKPGQELWVTEALNNGNTIDQIAVAVRTFR